MDTLPRPTPRSAGGHPRFFVPADGQTSFSSSQDASVAAFTGPSEFPSRQQNEACRKNEASCVRLLRLSGVPHVQMLPNAQDIASFFEPPCTFPLKRVCRKTSFCSNSPRSTIFSNFFIFINHC